jgi:hypothetical protein
MQLLAMLLTLLIFLSLGSFLDGTWTAVICTTIGAYLYSVFIYASYWITAERDRNLVLYKHIEKDMSRGIRSGIYSVIPTFLLTLLAIVQCYTDSISVFLLPLYKLWMVPFIGLINLFVGFFPPLFLLLCVPAPFFAWFGYRNGFKLMRISDKIIYKGNRKPRSRDKRVR